MRIIKFPVSDRDYLGILEKKGSQTHKKIYYDALDIPYTSPKLGRPSAADLAELKAETDSLAFGIMEKTRLQDEDRINKAFNDSRTSDSEMKKIRLAMGMDNKEGKTIPRKGKN